MNGLQITGLVLIGACVVAILAAVFNGDKISLFIAALVLGIAGNVLYWLGKPHYAEDDEKPEGPHNNEQKPQNQPPAS
jgi:hypothetical protein